MTDTMKKNLKELLAGIFKAVVVFISAFLGSSV